MGLFSTIFGTRKNKEIIRDVSEEARHFEAKNIVFFDTEVSEKRKIVLDYGAIKINGEQMHSKLTQNFAAFIGGAEFLCGHNIVDHDLKYVSDAVAQSKTKYFIDTLYLSPLMFPKVPYHKLVKDDKLETGEINNPLNDAIKAKDLFFDEVSAFEAMDKDFKNILYCLLKDKKGYGDLFKFVGFTAESIDIVGAIKDYFQRKICANANVSDMVERYPIELAYALSQILVINKNSITPPWVLLRYPRVENIIHFLRNKRCLGCAYCETFLDEIKALKRFYKYEDFRKFDGKPLQRDAVRAAIAEKSILAIFPTGGGKSITFQLPALMAGENEKGLTVVISPLQSLMKDQVDNLEKQHSIVSAVTINGSLDPIERANAFEMVHNGFATIL